MNAALAAAATLVAAAFTLSTWDRWLRRRRSHELAWTISLATFTLGSAALWWAESTGWNLANFRLFYLAGVRVRHIDELSSIVAAKRVSIGVVATPGTAAQDAADHLVAAGVTSILNFAPVVLTVPRSVEVRKVDLAVELQILCYHEQRRGGSIHAVPHRSATA